MPLTMLIINDLRLDVVPAFLGSCKGFLVAEVLVEIEPAHDILGLYPPVEVVVDVTCVEVCLVNHRTVGTQPFLAGFCHFADNGFDTRQHLSVAQDEGSLVHEPRALDVVAVALEPACTTRPVHIEEEVEVVGLGIEDAVGKDADDVTQGAFDPCDQIARHRNVDRKHGADDGDVVAR